MVVYPILHCKKDEYYISENKYGDLKDATFFTWEYITETLMPTLSDNHVVDIGKSISNNDYNIYLSKIKLEPQITIGFAEKTPKFVANGKHLVELE